MATKRERPAVIKNPVRSEHPEVVEPADWRDRGVGSDLATPLWFGANDDHGAYTRFGFGWGPIEVTRDERLENGTRVVKVYVAGHEVATVRVSDDGRTISVKTGEASEDQMVSVPVSTCKTETDSVVLSKLRGLVKVLKTDLTPRRREKRYVPKSTIDAIDDIIKVVDDA